MSGVEAIAISILIIGAVCGLGCLLYNAFDAKWWENLGLGFMAGVCGTIVVIAVAIAIVLAIYGVADVVT